MTPRPGSIPNPLRTLGVARILAGGWFVASGVTTLRQASFLVSQAARLFRPDSGTTGAPLRSLLTLISAAALILIGLGLAAMGWRWTRRVRLPPTGPLAIDRDEVRATLNNHILPAYGDGRTTAYWPLRRWLPDELAEMTWWRRDIMNMGVRAFVLSCCLLLGLTVGCLAVPAIWGGDPLGPFPATFATMLTVATAVWAVLALMLIGSTGPRVESVAFPLPAIAKQSWKPQGEVIIESAPLMLDRDPSALAVTIGVTGVAVQCLLMTWWSVSPIDYPLLATTLIRDAGSITGGILFFVLGGRMVAAAATLLQVFRYESTLVLIEGASGTWIARAAALRTASRGLTGPRQVVAAVGGIQVLEAAQSLIQEYGQRISRPA